MGYSGPSLGYISSALHASYLMISFSQVLPASQNSGDDFFLLRIPGSLFLFIFSHSAPKKFSDPQLKNSMSPPAKLKNSSRAASSWLEKHSAITLVRFFFVNFFFRLATRLDL